jgi:hypothetical protein
MRIGAAAAIVEGELVPGDVDVSDGVVVAVGVARGGSASQPRGSSTCR